MIYFLRKQLGRIRLLKDSDFIIPNVKESDLSAAQEARESVASLAPLSIDNAMSPSEREWTANRIALRNLILYSDLRFFLRWLVIRATMFTTETVYTATELSYLRASGALPADLVEDPVGSPSRLLAYPGTSANLVHHVYHLERYERETSTRVADLPFILEFGGGYGSLCRLAQRRSARGAYVIYDLPEFSILQRYYLRSIGYTVKSVSDFEVPAANDPDSGGIYLISSEEDLTHIAGRKGNEGLLIGTWSISETPLSFRENFFRMVGNFSHYLIAYQNRFNEVDNVNYFEQWQKARSQIRWHSEAIRHLPGHRYLFGTSSSRSTTKPE